MKKLSLLAVLVIFIIPPRVFGQFEMVEFDYQNSFFNNGQLLPAETYMIFNGPIDPEVSMIEIDIYKAKANKTRPSLYHTTWFRAKGDKASIFRVPISYKLQGNTNYDFIFSYYRPLEALEKANLRKSLEEYLDIYIDQSLLVQKDQIKWDKSERVMISDLNSIVERGLTFYRSANQINFEGFSDLVKGGLSRVAKPRPTQPTTPGAAIPTSNPLEDENVKDLIQSLKSLIHAEIDPILNSKLVIKNDVREIFEYETEKTRSALAVNVGYGGVFLDGNISDLSYDAAPYVGISIPLGNRALAGRVLSNTSLSLGVFTQNFTDKNEQEVTGPIFGRPYFIGLGYNVFRFIKINAGATAIEQVGASGAGNGNANLDVSAIKVKPFIGLSAEIDLWIGLREKR